MINNKRITLSIDPGETTSLAVCGNDGKLIHGYEFKMPYSKEPCQRIAIFKREFGNLIDAIFNEHCINQALLEVPYSIGPSQVAYLYQRSGNAMDLVKLISTAFAIHSVLSEKGCLVMTIPATYWLSNKEKFTFKKYAAMDLIDYKKYPHIKANRDGILDAVLMCKRYNGDVNLQHRVNCFMTADFSNKVKK